MRPSFGSFLVARPAGVEPTHQPSVEDVRAAPVDEEPRPAWHGACRLFVMPAPWRYKADEEPKRKHHWAEPYAGFIVEHGETVGKCPASISPALAERLLNTQGVPWSNPNLPATPWPDRIYVVHEGVVYRAKPTDVGVSYHAFPELPERLRELPKKVRNEILALADTLGCREGEQGWMDG